MGYVDDVSRYRTGEGSAAGLLQDDAQYDYLQDTANRVRALASANPTLASDPVGLKRIAELDMPIEDLVANSSSLYANLRVDNMAKSLATQTPSQQRMVWGQLSDYQRQALGTLGYKPPDKHGGGGLASWTGSGALIGDALHQGLRGAGLAGSAGARIVNTTMQLPVVNETLDAMIWLGDQPAHLYRTIKLMDPDSQWVALGMGLVAAGGIAAAPFTGGASLGFTALAGQVLGGGLLAATGAAILTNPNDWRHAFQESWNGEKVFTREAQADARKLLGSERLAALARDNAWDADLEDVAFEIAGVRGGSPGSESSTRALVKYADRMADPGTPQHEALVTQLMAIAEVPEFQQAVRTLQDSKISFGRDVANVLGFEPGDTGYGLVSGAADALWVISLDPTLIGGKALQWRKVARYGLPVSADVDATLTALAKQADDVPRIGRAIDEVLVGIDGRSFDHVARRVPAAKEQFSPLLGWVDAERAMGRIEGAVTRDDYFRWMKEGRGLEKMMAGQGVRVGESKLMMPGYGYEVLGKVIEPAVAKIWAKEVIDIADTNRSYAAIRRRVGAGDEAFRQAASIEEMGAKYGLTADQLVEYGDPFERTKQWMDWIDERKGLNVAVRQLGALGGALTSMLPMGRSIRLTGPQSADDIVRMTEMGRIVGMSHSQRAMWREALMAETNLAKRREMATSFLDAMLTTGGARETAKGGELLDQFIYKYRQIYSTVDHAKYALGGNLVPGGVLGKHLAVEMPFPDLVELQKAARKGDVLRHFSDLSNSHIGDLVMNKIWKPAVLLRIGFIPRAAGEEALSFLAREGISAYITQFGHRSIAEGQLFDEFYEEATKAVRFRDARYSQEAVDKLARMEYATHVRPFERILASNRWNSPHVQKLGDFTLGWRTATEESLADYSRSLRASLEHGVAPSFPGRIPEKYRTALAGRPDSFRRMVLSGADPEMVESTKLFTSRFAEPIMRELSARNANIWLDTTPLPDALMLDGPLDSKGNPTTVETKVNFGTSRVYTQDDPAVNRAATWSVTDRTTDPLFGKATTEVYVRTLPATLHGREAEIRRARELYVGMESYPLKEILTHALSPSTAQWGPMMLGLRNGHHELVAASLYDELGTLPSKAELLKWADKHKATLGKYKRKDVAELFDIFDGLSVKEQQWAMAHLKWSDSFGMARPPAGGTTGVLEHVGPGPAQPPSTTWADTNRDLTIAHGRAASQLDGFDASVVDGIHPSAPTVAPHPVLEEAESDLLAAQLAVKHAGPGIAAEKAAIGFNEADALLSTADIQRKYKIGYAKARRLQESADSSFHAAASRNLADAVHNHESALNAFGDEQDLARREWTQAKRAELEQTVKSAERDLGAHRAARKDPPPPPPTASAKPVDPDPFGTGSEFLYTREQADRAKYQLHLEAIKDPANKHIVEGMTRGSRTADGRIVVDPQRPGQMRTYVPTIAPDTARTFVGRVAAEGSESLRTELTAYLASIRGSLTSEELALIDKIDPRTLDHFINRVTGQNWNPIIASAAAAGNGTLPLAVMAFDDPEIAKLMSRVVESFITGTDVRTVTHGYGHLVGPDKLAKAEPVVVDGFSIPMATRQGRHAWDIDPRTTTPRITPGNIQDPLITLANGAKVPGATLDEAYEEWARLSTADANAALRPAATREMRVDTEGLFYDQARTRPVTVGTITKPRTTFYDGLGRPVLAKGEGFTGITQSSETIDYAMSGVGPAMLDAVDEHTGRMLWNGDDRKVPFLSPREQEARFLEVPLQRSFRHHYTDWDPSELPAQIVGPELIPPQKKMVIQKITDVGFEKIISPAIDAAIRHPMAVHEFNKAMKVNRNLMKWMRNPQIWEQEMPAQFRSVLRAAKLDTPDDVLAGLLRQVLPETDKLDAAMLATMDDAGLINYMHERMWADTPVERQANVDDLKRWKGSTPEATAAARKLAAFPWWSVPLRGSDDQYARLLGVYERYLGDVLDRPFKVVASQAVDLPAELAKPLQWKAGPIAPNDWARLDTVGRRRAKDRMKIDGEHAHAVLRAARKNLAVADATAAEYASQRAITNGMQFIDSHEIRSQLGEYAKAFTPFWYAEENFLKRWARTLKMHPEAIRKGQLLYMGLKSGGVIQTDENGQDWMVVPASGVAIEALGKIPGVGKVLPAGAVFRFQPLQSLPGFDPSQTGIPQASPLFAFGLTGAAQLFPELEPLQRALIGQRATNVSALGQFVPATFRKLYEAVTKDEDSSRKYASAMASAAQVLEAHGHGLPDNADASMIDEYIRSLRNSTRTVLIAQTMAAFILPGSPSVQYTGDSNTELSHLSGIDVKDIPEMFAADFRDLVYALGIEEGTIAYLKIHPGAGPHDIVNPLALTVSKSATSAGRSVPATSDAVEFYRSNENFMQAYPKGATWLIPPQKPGDHSFNQYAYTQQFITDMRTLRTPEEFVLAMKFKEGALEYFQAKDYYDKKHAEFETAGNTQAKRVLNTNWEQWSSVYKAQHPVFATELESGKSRQRRQETITELRVAVADPEAPQTPYGGYVKSMMDAFDYYKLKLSELTQSRSREAQEKADAFRGQYADWVDRFIFDHPEIESLWVSVLRPEAALT